MQGAEWAPIPGEAVQPWGERAGRVMGEVCYLKKWSECMGRVVRLWRGKPHRTRPG